MAKILTSVTGMHEHYISVCYGAPQMTQFSTLNLTTAGSVTAQAQTNVAATLPAFGANTKTFVLVDSITDIPATMTVTIKNSAVSIGSATIPPHAPIDSIFPVFLTAGVYGVIPITAFTVDLTGSVPGVVLQLMFLDDAAASWQDLGLNYNEALEFAEGAALAPVARGFNGTDHSKRIPVVNQFRIAQLYCSQFEGVANLKGRTVMIKDEVRTDGGSIVKETNYVMKATVQNTQMNVGGGGGAAAADSVNCTGFFARCLTWTQDATSLTATA